MTASNSISRKTLIVLTLTIALATTNGFADRPVHETRDAATDGTVEIENLAGSVTVEGWDRAQVEVTGTIADQAEELAIDTTSRRVSIRVELPEHSRRMAGSDLTIRVPSGSRVSVSTVSADVDVSSVSGRLELETVSGSLEVHDRPAEIEAASVSGSIQVEHAPARSEIGSVSGSITIHAAEGHLEAENVSGRIDVEGPGLDGAEVATVSGQIQIETNLGGNGTFEVESVSGNIVFVVPAGADAEYELSTFSGRIRSDLGPAPEKNDFGPGEEISFSQGRGGPVVVLESFSGTVELRTR